MIVSPEIVAEQVMGYVVWAVEMIPTLSSTPTKNNVALLPQWPQYYTGLLQAAGYLLLDHQKDKLLIISQQSQHPKEVFVDTNVYDSTFGYARKQSKTDVSTIVRQLKAKCFWDFQEDTIQNITSQLPFVRTITQTKTIVHLAIGEDISKIQQQHIISRIKKHISDYNIVMLTNIAFPASPQYKRDDEQKILDKLIIQKTGKTTPLLHIFKHITDTTKAKVIAYVDPGKQAKKSSIALRYVCAVG